MTLGTVSLEVGVTHSGVTEQFSTEHVTTHNLRSVLTRCGPSVAIA